MGIQQRKAREKAELRQKIVAAARHLFVSEGYERVSMRKIAERIDYSPTTIYLYFTNKAELLDSVCEETQLRLLSEVERLVDDGLDPLGALKACAEAYARFGLDHPEDYRLMVILRPEYEEGLGIEEGSVVEKLLGYLNSVVSECMARGQIRKGDVTLTSQAVWAAVHGAVSLVISYPDFPWADREGMVAHVIDTTIAGLTLSRPSSTRPPSTSGRG